MAQLGKEIKRENSKANIITINKELDSFRDIKTAGSNAQLLSGGLATMLVGRVVSAITPPGL